MGAFFKFNLFLNECLSQAVRNQWAVDELCEGFNRRCWESRRKIYPAFRRDSRAPQVLGRVFQVSIGLRKDRLYSYTNSNCSILIFFLMTSAKKSDIKGQYSTAYNELKSKDYATMIQPAYDVVSAKCFKWSNCFGAISPYEAIAFRPQFRCGIKVHIYNNLP